MLHVSTQKLIAKLCELTAQGGIQWRHDESGATVFETEGYLVEATGRPALFRVLASDGSELERVEADTLAASPWPGGDGSFADRVSTMAAQADRFARGTDHAISRILSSLSASSVADATDAPVEEDRHAAAPTPEFSGVQSATDPFKRSSEVFGRTRSFAAASRTHHRSTPEARPVSAIGKITASGPLLATPAPTERDDQTRNSPAAGETAEHGHPESTTETSRPPPETVSPDVYKPLS